MKLICSFLLPFLLLLQQTEPPEFLFKQSNPDKTTLRITRSAPHPNPDKHSSEDADTRHTPDSTRTWKAEMLDDQGNVSKVIFQCEEGYYDTERLSGISPSTPFRILAAKPFHDGVVVVQTDQGFLQGIVYSHISAETVDQLFLLNTHEISYDADTKCKGTIDGDYESGTLTISLTAPDGTNKRFKLVKGKDESKWEEIKKAGTQPTTK